MSNYRISSIETALKRYERLPEKEGKKAILLTPQSGYFLYGNRFCNIQEYELELVSDCCEVHGKYVQSSLFFGILRNDFYVAGDRPFTPKLVSVIFHINVEEDEPLRGILLIRGQEARFSLFSDASIEELYRLSRTIDPYPGKPVPPDPELQQYAEQLRQNDLHYFTSLYMQGKQLKKSSIPNIIKNKGEI